MSGFVKPYCAVAINKNFFLALLYCFKSCARVLYNGYMLQQYLNWHFYPGKPLFS